MKAFDVVALGELLVDFTENGISAQGNPMLEANPGGAPCNVLSMLQNLEKKTAFIGKVGADAFGQMLMQAVKNQGINTDNLVTDNTVHTTLAFVHTDKDGDRSFSFYRNPGADMMLRWNEIHEDVLADTKIFHFGTLSMTDEQIEKVTKKAVEKAKSEGVLISFDPNLRPPLWKNLEDARRQMWYGISQCDILKISDDEIAFLTGTDDIDGGVEDILKQSQPALICATMGKNGSKAFYKGKGVFCEPFLRNDTIETTGAGDTFMACVLNAVLEKGLEALSEKDLFEMLRFANAAASLVTTRKGALRVMPRGEEITALIGD
ncbi:carbohydrate kinase [bacterium 210820-DFI.6.38]|nr:carbohydrate kinase [Clostridium sp.]MCB6991577.1 carbohydrate kinase [bacterium 210820-DFI.6.38]